MALSPYPIDPALTAIAIAYRNPGYIADIVLPRILVGKQKFSFMQYAADTFFNVPETLVGRRSRPNQATLDATEVTDATEDHGLDGGVPRVDIENADARRLAELNIADPALEGAAVPEAEGAVENGAVPPAAPSSPVQE